MTSKEWVLLIVPIVFNGLFLYAIQSFFQKHNKKIMDKYEKEKRTHEIFFDMLLSLKKDYRTLGYSIIEKPNDVLQIQENIGIYNRRVRSLLDYFDDHSQYFVKQKNQIAELKAYFEAYVEYFSKKTTLNDDERSKMSKDLNQINVYTEELLRLF